MILHSLFQMMNPYLMRSIDIPNKFAITTITSEMCLVLMISFQ